MNIQEFVTYHYVHTGSDPPVEDESWDDELFEPPLEDESWDHELFLQYLESRLQDQKVQCSATQTSCRQMQFLRLSWP